MGGRGSLSPWAKQHAEIVTQEALSWARSKIGSRSYGRWAWNGTFLPGTAKCNLFVEHAFNKGNPKDRPFPFTPSRTLLASGIGRMRNYSAEEIYHGRVQNFKHVKKPKPGDIAADGAHVGIVSGNGKTISASIFTGTVVENGWGFRKNRSPAPNMRFFRYTGDDKWHQKKL
ncbi:MAG: hypothetical protein E7055_15875 [Lentisphaerae bacterium]|nr:hypothetical protein [Lentisphaerota bacterium]